MTFERVRELIGDPAQFRREQESYQRSADLVANNWPAFMRDYRNEYIAVHDGTVVAHGTNFGRVLDEVDALGFPRRNTLVRLIDDSDAVLMLACR